MKTTKQRVICPNSIKCNEVFGGDGECAHAGIHDLVEAKGKNTLSSNFRYPCLTPLGHCPSCISIDSEKGQKISTKYFEWLMVGNIHAKKETKR